MTFPSEIYIVRSTHSGVLSSSFWLWIQQNLAKIHKIQWDLPRIWLNLIGSYEISLDLVIFSPDQAKFSLFLGLLLPLLVHLNPTSTDENLICPTCLPYQLAGSLVLFHLTWLVDFGLGINPTRGHLCFFNKNIPSVEWTGWRWKFIQLFPF